MMDTIKSLLSSRKTWTAIATAVTAGAAKLLPLLAVWFAWTPEHVAQLQAAAGEFANLITALGGLVILAIGVEDAGAKVGLPPPNPGAPAPVNPKPAGE